jgi:hypothetical protein
LGILFDQGAAHWKFLRRLNIIFVNNRPTSVIQAFEILFAWHNRWRNTRSNTSPLSSLSRPFSILPTILIHESFVLVLDLLDVLVDKVFVTHVEEVTSVSKDAYLKFFIIVRVGSVPAFHTTILVVLRIKL